ncbi:uncharacterized protein LOC133115200 [Conger conger]|uniref:uncharacterized protein LOC133115200 n=2 Tax=Conger conger TaxID=82655 RepID=UPI002A59B4B8|nr:uncharacterized protein LOC133115200 [Conger conger]
MDHTWEELDQLAAGYISDTMSYIHTVQEFCIIHSMWLLHRKSELKRMQDVIMDRAKKINPTANHCLNSEDKMKAFGEYMCSKVTEVTAEGRTQELEEELGCLLEDTLKGLKKLTPFLEAVEMLAVTSLSVFEEENPVCQLPEGVSADAVRSVIAAARRACPLLIHFQRDNSEFFQTSLVNMDLLAFQLDKYLRVSQKLYEMLQESSGSIPFHGINYRAENASENDPCPILTNEAIQNMFDHLTELRRIRLDQHFRMTYLSRGSAQQFIDQFSQSFSKMQQFLEALEKEAVQLDRMKMGASIFRILCSVLGFVGGILSVVSVVSIVLLLNVGSCLGIAGAIIGILICCIEIGFNFCHGKKIKKIFENYSKDVKIMLECLEKAASPIIRSTVPDVLNVIATVLKAAKITYSLIKVIDIIADASTLGAEEVASSTVKVVTQEVKAARNITNMAANLTDIRQLAKGTPPARSTCDLVLIIGSNVFCMGMDLYFIYKEIKTLANGDKSDVSKVIRRRASLLKTELDEWEKIHGSLCTGLSSFETSEEVLQRPFYTLHEESS